MTFAPPLTHAVPIALLVEVKVIVTPVSHDELKEKPVAVPMLVPFNQTVRVDVESVVVDGVAGLITGSEDAAMASAVRTGLQRCGETAQLIDVAGRPPHERPRAEACQRAFAAKTAAYTAFNEALAADGDFMAVQKGTRAFLAGIRESTPQMRTCNTPT
jgi:hypothetical protein